MKNIHAIVAGYILCLLFFTFPIELSGQGSQWTSSVNVGGSGGAPWADWIIDVITTSEGNYLGVGFAREDELNVPRDHPDVPAYCLISPNGTLLRDGVIETDPINPSQGRLANVVEASNDSYYAVGFLGGFQGSQRLVVRINKTSLDAVYYQPEVTHSDPGKKINFSRLNEIIDVPGTVPYLLCSGWVEGELVDGNGNVIGNFPREKWLVAINYDGTIKDQIFLPQSGSESSELSTVSFEQLGGGTIRIYGASYVVTNLDGGFGSYRRNDSDIAISMLEYNPTSGFQTETVSSVNSITQGPRDNIANAQVGSGDIFENFPPAFPSGTFETLPYDKFPYGPKYIGTAFERNFSNCNESAPVNDFYIEDWSDGSEDVPYSMVLTSDQIVVSALLNRIIMWSGTNNDLGGDTDPGLHCDAGPCSVFDSDYYLWGEAYLLFFDKSDLSLQKATYLSSMSGGDFIPKVIKTSDGGFAVSGTVSGCPDGLPIVDGAEHIMVIKLDSDGDIKWRKHINGQGGGACGFAITETPDGGIIVAGNTEDDGQEHDENFCFIKLSSDCTYEADVVPNSGKDYIVAANEPVWSTSRTVRARVVVPAGRTLTINGSSTVIRFADSKEVYDASDRHPIGITVEAGGKLYVSSATLTGYNCDGVEKMWDGINVVGNPNLEQTATNQGICSLIVASIVNARQGVVTSGVWCSTSKIVSPPYGGTGSQSSLETSVLNHGGPNGGGLVFGLNSNFINNKRSAIFMQYPHNLNKSRFFNCDFISNGPLVDPTETLQPIANNYHNNEPRGTSTHVSIWNTRVQFNNCKFLGSTSIIPEYRPFGIEGDEPKIVASGGNMLNLKVGIECRGALGGILANVNAGSITFDNVFQGINLRNSVADVVKNCTFSNIPEPSTYTSLSPSGIFGQFNKGALIQLNTFTGANPDKDSWGIVEHNTQNQGCEIKENIFNASRVGNQFEGSNNQLDARCNDYTSMGFSAWYCAVTFGSGTLKPQGNSGISGQKADNEFYDFCDGSSNIHIEADDNFTPFGYFDKIGNPHPIDPDCVNDIVSVNIEQDQSELTCFVPGPPCPPCPVEPCPCTPRDIYLASNKTVQDRNIALRSMIHIGFAADTTDLPADYNGALFVLADRNEPEDRSILVGSLASMGRYTEAHTENALLIASDAESVAYKAYLDNVIGAGTDLLSLSDSNYQVALNALEDQNVSTRAMAENLLRLRQGVYTPLVAVQPQATAQRDAAKPAMQEKNQSSVTVWPNPFTHEVAFDLSTLQAGPMYRLQITDIYGRQVLNTQTQGGSGMLFNWRAAEIPDGTYFYQIRSGTALVANGKMVKTSQ